MTKKQTATAPLPRPLGALDELRVAHLNLMKRGEAKAAFNDIAFVTDIRSFVDRLQASGTNLADPIDRREAQGILDYWSSSVVSNRGVDLKTWSQPRIDAYVKSQPSGSSSADIEKTKLELSKIDENARQLIRIGAIARQWRLGGRSVGYLLGGDALENAKRFLGQDKDIDELIAASDEFVKAKNRSWRNGALALIAVLLATVVVLVYLVFQLNTAIREAEKIRLDLDKSNKDLVIRNNDLADQLVANAQLSGQIVLSSDFADYIKNLESNITNNQNGTLQDGGPLPDVKSFDIGSEDDRLNAALDFDRRLRLKGNTPADQINLARSLVAMTSSEQFALLTPKGRHYLLFILSLIPVQDWNVSTLDAQWSVIRDNVRKNLTDLKSTIDAKRITLEPKTQQYLDALRANVGITN